MSPNCTYSMLYLSYWWQIWTYLTAVIQWLIRAMSPRELVYSNMLLTGQMGAACVLLPFLVWLVALLCCSAPLLCRWWWWWNTFSSLDSFPGTVFMRWLLMKINLSSRLASWAWRRLTTTSDMIFFSCWLCSSTDPCSWSVSVHSDAHTRQAVSKAMFVLWYRMKATRAELATFHFSKYTLANITVRLGVKNVVFLRSNYNLGDKMHWL